MKTIVILYVYYFSYHHKDVQFSLVCISQVWRFLPFISPDEKSKGGCDSCKSLPQLQETMGNTAWSGHHSQDVKMGQTPGQVELCLFQADSGQRGCWQDPSHGPVLGTPPPRISVHPLLPLLHTLSTRALQMTPQHSPLSALLFHR